MTRNIAATLRTVMDDATHAQKHRAHTPVGMHEPTAYLPTPAARSLVACLKTETLPSLFDNNGRIRRTPKAAPAGVTVMMDAALIAGSRVADAGAHVLVYPDAIKPHSDGRGTIDVESRPVAFRNVESAVFSSVDVENEDDAPVIDLPVFSASIDWKDATAKGVRFEVPRSVRRRVDPDQLCEEIMLALTLGLARAADDTLLTAINATAPTAFSLAKAAAQGLRFYELSALVGADGAGATVEQEGALRVAGVPAELTPDMPGTLVGAWNRAGVAIKDEVSIHFERLGTSGGLAVTAWASMLALVPDAGKFWVVA